MLNIHFEPICVFPLSRLMFFLHFMFFFVFGRGIHTYGVCTVFEFSRLNLLGKSLNVYGIVICYDCRFASISIINNNRMCEELS